MDNNTMQSMTSTLGSQSQQSGQPLNPEPAPPQNNGQSAQEGASVLNTTSAGPPPPTPPVKRGPGRPKGSGVKAKFIDPDAPVVPKRPVGRPRKDGLPAGSVPRQPPSSTRKRKIAAPGTFAASGDSSQQLQMASASGPPYMGVPPYNYQPVASTSNPMWPVSTGYSTLSAALQSEPPPRRTESLGPSATRATTIDPSLTQDDQWADLLQSDVKTLLQQLVSALQTPNPMSRAGLSVEDAFKFHMSTLTSKPGATSIPSLYSILKTFWLPTSPAYFALTSSSSTTPTPPEHRFLYWDPQPLVFNGIACPFCTTPLLNAGCIKTGPIKIYDLGKPFFIIGCQYVCQSPPCKVATQSGEGRSFASTDRVILRALPPILREELAAVMLSSPLENGNPWNWHAMGVSTALWSLVRGLLSVGLGRDTSLQIIRGTQVALLPPVYQKVEEESHAEQHVEQDTENGDNSQEMDTHGPETDTPSAAYTDAWKAHSAVGAVNGEAQEQQAEVQSSPAPVSVPIPNNLPIPYGYAVAHYLPYPYGPYPTFHQAPEAGGSGGASLKRPGEPLSGEQSKRIRHCVKCGSKECKGKGGRGFCTNACQDCGKPECKGRNSKRPDKTCADAWS